MYMYIHANISFLKNWHFNYGSPSATHIQSLKEYPRILTKCEGGNSKIPIFQLFNQLLGIWKYSLS